MTTREFERTQAPLERQETPLSGPQARSLQLETQLETELPIHRGSERWLERLEKGIRDQQGRGDPLADEHKVSLERGLRAHTPYLALLPNEALKESLDKVRLHSDEASFALTEGEQTPVFTAGNEIFFDRGTLDLQSKDGQSRLYKALGEVVQQKLNKVQPLSAEKDVSLEREAFDLGEKTARDEALEADTRLKKEKGQLEGLWKNLDPLAREEDAVRAGKPPEPALETLPRLLELSRLSLAQNKSSGAKKPDKDGAESALEGKTL